MFFTRVKIFLTFFIILILGTFGSQKTGNASELEIDKPSLVSDALLNYYRSFVVTSTYKPVTYRSSIIVPEMIWPTDSDIVVSGYGYRTPSCYACSSDHKGVDFTPGSGSPVYASMDGIVSRIEYRGGFGLHVYIDHIAVINNTSQKWQTIYAHLQEGSVPEDLSVGQIIESGTIIGRVGNTGISTGPHLHFEILVEGVNVDPEKYLRMYANQ